MPPLTETTNAVAPITPSALIQKVLGKRATKTNDQPHSRRASSKLTGTGGSNLHDKPPKHSSKTESNHKYYSWFKSQCSDVMTRRYSSLTPTPSVKNKWGSFISIKTAYNSNDYMTHLPQRAPTSLRIGMNGGSLEQIFVFYAKLQKPGVQKMKKSLTFDEVNQANTTLSYFEFLCAVRDFDIVPNIITKNDVNGIWKCCKSRRGQRSTPESVLNEVRQSEGRRTGSLGGGLSSAITDNASATLHFASLLTTARSSQLEFSDFLEILCYVALVAFNRKEDPEDKVRALVTFMHLDDASHVSNQIRTRGMQTSARFNYRSKGETDPLGGEKLRDERDRERAALLISNAKGPLRHSRDGEVKFKGWNDADTVKGSRFLGDDTRRIWEETREVVVGTIVGRESDPTTFDDYDDYGEEMYEDNDGVDDDYTRSTRRTSKSQMTTRTMDTSFWSGRNLTKKKTLGVDHTDLLNELYTEFLTEILAPYKFKKANDMKPSWTEFKGPFMHFGAISRYRKGGYKALLSVTNTGENPILVTPEAYWFDKKGAICWAAENVGEVEDGGSGNGVDVIDITFEPAVIPPGLRKVINLTLNPNCFSRNDEFLGGINLEVSIVPREQGKLAYRDPRGGTEMRRKSR